LLNFARKGGSDQYNFCSLGTNSQGLDGEKKRRKRRTASCPTRQRGKRVMFSEINRSPVWGEKKKDEPLAGFRRERRMGVP